MIPIDHGAALHEAIEERYRAEPFWALGKGHNDLDYNFDPFIDRVSAFLDEYLGDYKSRSKSRGKKKRKSDSKKPHRSTSIEERVSASSSLVR